MQHLSYWDQLKSLNLYSLQRRRERYIIIYTWRILEGSAPNISEGPTSISALWHARRGRSCYVPTIRPSVPARIQNIRRASLGVKGPRLFNCLPIHLRNLTEVSTASFKAALDKYLQSIPDEPLIPGYTMYRSVDTNSILDWSAHTHHQVGTSTYRTTDTSMTTAASMMSP